MTGELGYCKKRVIFEISRRIGVSNFRRLKSRHTHTGHADCSFSSTIVPRMEISYFLTVKRDETVLVNPAMISS